MAICPYCGKMHPALCPRIKSIEYQENGLFIKRIEFFPPTRIDLGSVTVFENDVVTPLNS